MTDEEKLKRLDEISDELFKMANDFALAKKPGVGCYLHESVNNIFAAQKNIKSGSEEIPIEFISRSMGLGMGTSMIDLQIKDEKYRDDLKDENND